MAVDTGEGPRWEGNEMAERKRYGKRGTDTGAVRGECGKNGCGRFLYLKPNRLADNGKYYHPECLPRSATMTVEGSIPKADTVARWTGEGRTLAVQREARKAEREATEATEE